MFKFINKIGLNRFSSNIIDTDVYPCIDKTASINSVNYITNLEEIILNILKSKRNKRVLKKIFNSFDFDITFNYINKNDHEIAQKQFFCTKTAFVKTILMLKQKNILSNKDNLFLESLLSKDSIMGNKELCDGIVVQEIQGKEYKIQTKQIFDTLLLPEDKLISLLHDENKLGMKKEIFGCLVKNFFDNFSDLYLFSSDFFEKLTIISKETKFLKLYVRLRSKPKYLSKMELKSEFKEKLIASIPKEFDETQKAFYLYLKLCQIFTYDQENFAGGTLEIFTNNHKDFDYLKNIDENNNDVVCYDLICCYAKLLEELNIPFTISSSRYGVGHVSLNLVTDMYDIDVDGVKTVVEGDMARAKSNLVLRGFSLSNRMPYMQKEFISTINGVYDYLKLNNDQVFMDEEELISEYRKKYATFKLPIAERKKILFQEVKQCCLKGTDRILYFKKIFKALFECSNGVIAVKNNKPIDKNKMFDVAIIFYLSFDESGCSIKFINDDKFYKNDEIEGKGMETEYYISYNDGSINKVTRKELKDMYNSKIIEDISGTLVDFFGGERNLEPKTSGKSR